MRWAPPWWYPSFKLLGDGGLLSQKNDEMHIKSAFHMEFILMISHNYQKNWEQRPITPPSQIIYNERINSTKS